MNKVFLSLLVSFFLIMGYGFAQTTPPAADAPAAPAAAPETEKPVMHHEHHADHHPEIHKAMRKLRAAREDLEKAAHDYGGHKAKALDAIDGAISELRAALAFDSDKK